MAKIIPKRQSYIPRSTIRIHDRDGRDFESPQIIALLSGQNDAFQWCGSIDWTCYQYSYRFEAGSEVLLRAMSYEQ